MAPGSFDVRKVYDHDVGDEAGASDRYRVLVDRLWPRGVARATLALDEWCRDVAPTTELRRWYAHEVSRFDEFARRYVAELRGAPASDAVARLRAIAADHTVVLLTATRDVGHSGAEVLRGFLAEAR